MIYENGLNNARVGCTLANEDVTELFVLEMYLLESHEVELDEAKMFWRRVVCAFCLHILTLVDANLKLGHEFYEYSPLCLIQKTNFDSLEKCANTFCPIFWNPNIRIHYLYKYILNMSS